MTQHIQIRALPGESPRDYNNAGAAINLDPAMPWQIGIDLLTSHRLTLTQTRTEMPQSHLIADARYLSPNGQTQIYLAVIETGDTIPDPLHPAETENDFEPLDYTNELWRSREIYPPAGQMHPISLSRSYDVFQRVPAGTLSKYKITIYQGSAASSDAPVLLTKTVTVTDLSSQEYEITWGADTPEIEAVGYRTTREVYLWDSDEESHELSTARPATDVDLTDVSVDGDIKSNIINILDQLPDAIREGLAYRTIVDSYSAEEHVPWYDGSADLTGESTANYTPHATVTVSQSEANIRRGTNYLQIEVEYADDPGEWVPISAGTITVETSAIIAAPTGTAAGDDSYTTTDESCTTDWP